MASGRLASWMRSLRRGPQRLTALVDRETLQTSAPWAGGGVLRARALVDDVRHHLELAAVCSYFPSIEHPASEMRTNEAEEGGF